MSREVDRIIRLFETEKTILVTTNSFHDNGDYTLYSSKDKLKEIENNCILEEDENIKIKYNGNENYYPTLNIVIQYYYSFK